MGDKVRGTVTPLSESISVQDAENIAKKVAEAIETQMQQLQTLQGFADENRSLHKLLLELPDLISYNIMVPFGKAAFMPGRLIHTNELLVLLGEGYYAERSAKQAAEILMRRSEFITSKIDALKEQIKDLEAEAAFAKDTAAEAAGGLVEIREEYTEPSLQSAVETTKTTNTATATTQDEKEADSDSEHSRIMARLAELEMAEQAAGEDDDEDEDEEEEEIETNLRAAFRRSLLDDSDEDEEDEDEDDEEDEDEEELDLDDRTASNTLLNKSAVRLSQIEEEDSREEFQSSIITSQHGSQVQARGLGTQSIGAKLTAGPSGQRHVQFSKTENIANSASPQPLPPRDVKASAAQQRAFTGSVVERNTDLLPPVAPAAPEAPPSRPVSKFKQRQG